jgi:cytochrome subunit of sulfide dehydrogenase
MTLKLLAALALTAASTLSWAQVAAGPAVGNADVLYIKSLAATCANCHGTDGRAVDGSSVPSIAGMPKIYIVQQMQAFKNGQRPATVMHQLARGYTDQQIDQIAGYFAALKR